MNPQARSFTSAFTLALYLVASFAMGCSSNKTATANSSQNQPAAQNQSPAPSSAQPIGIDDLVAPIALYPDQLLGQVLALSVNPQEVLDIGNWLIQNQNLQGDALTQAVTAAGFSPPAQYLAHFPQVVDNMCQEMDWTKQLGEAFKSDQKSVMDAVQRKRTQAQQMGNLQSSQLMTVATKSDNGQNYVEIQPADPKVVYVPQYNPVTIYNTQAPAAPAAAPAATTATTTTTTTEEKKSGVSTGTAVAIGLLSFGVGMAVGSAIHQDDYYPYPAWGYGGVYYGGRPYYPPPYRPPVYAGYRPAYGYNPPANYHWNQYNRQTNVTINNNYYGRFNNTAGNRPTTLPANRPANNGYLGANNNRPGATQGDLRGQTTYAGARPHPANERPGASMANAVPPSQQLGNRGGVNNQMANNNRPGTQPGNRGGTQMASNVNRDMNRPGAGGGGAARPATMPSQPMNRGGDRGYGSGSSMGNAPATRPSTPAATSRPAMTQQAGNRSGGGAFGGGSAASDRAASNRGRASMGSSHGGGARGGHRR